MLCFLSAFKPACICLQEVGNSRFLSQSQFKNIFLKNYKPIFRRADPKYPGKRGLFIGIHNSYAFSTENADFDFIISANIFSFWNTKCSIGNMYFPQLRWPEARTWAFDELKLWIGNHNNNTPALLVGDFNMQDSSKFH